MKYFFTIFLLVFSFIDTYSITPIELEELANDRFLDGITINFKNFPGSNNYIDKFNLTEDELTMIGIWAFDGIVCRAPANRKYGPGVGISFYPNRYLKIEREDRDNGDIRSIYGEWKVENKVLLIKLKVKLIIENKKEKIEYLKYKVEYSSDENFYPVFKIPQYLYAYYNLEPFDWSLLPSQSKQFFEFQNDDAPRSRLLFDSLGDPPGNVQPDSEYGKILLYPQMSIEYFVDLLQVW